MEKLAMRKERREGGLGASHITSGAAVGVSGTSRTTGGAVIVHY
jgi:hypothetical protein